MDIIKIKEDKIIGTNFYARHIPSEAEYEEMQKALTERQLEKLQDLIKTARTEYHIGKRSYGWAFLFQAKEAPRQIWDSDEAQVPWDSNLESLKEYLNRSDVQIVDEYGREFTPDEFWNNEVGESLTVHEDPTGERHYYCHSTYNIDHPQDYIRDSHEQVDKNIRWCNCWFC